MENSANKLNLLTEEDIVVATCQTHLNMALCFLGCVELVLCN